MPSRLVTGVIGGFWLGMTGWMIYREVVPTMLAETSPSYLINLTDEIGSPTVNWKIFLNNKKIGACTSQIHMNEDLTYEFRNVMRFSEFFGIRQVDCAYRVTEERRLQSMRAK